ncbi:hypothetical protein KP509_25G003100 [Ceratopteris richardii]|uniref:Uncharacterized protein n=1 Tax=Ceratopteris richardii TaxID=49495 RepID=A0A8T2RMG6_CERRI|nr:hypothetical protein KP509_25G003100 [Ceratopteris richardii]
MADNPKYAYPHPAAQQQPCGFLSSSTFLTLRPFKLERERESYVVFFSRRLSSSRLLPPSCSSTATICTIAAFLEYGFSKRLMKAKQSKAYG